MLEGYRRWEIHTGGEALGWERIGYPMSSGLAHSVPRVSHKLPAMFLGQPILKIRKSETWLGSYYHQRNLGIKKVLR